MNTPLTGADMLDCAKCGEMASQSLDAPTDRHGLILSRSYYCHCFSGDCGNEGPHVSSSDESIRLWNEAQVRALAHHQPGRAGVSVKPFTYPVPPIGPLFDEARLHPEFDCSLNETIGTLDDMRAFFEKEAAYECENMDSGGSTIALGKWRRFAKTLENLIHDLPEARREKHAIRAHRDRLEAALRELQHGIARYLADPLRKKTCAHAEVFIELCGERVAAALAPPSATQGETK